MLREDERLARSDPKDFRVNLQNANGQLNDAEAFLRPSEYERMLRIREKELGTITDHGDC
jgi:hypothetical protein